MHQRVSGEATIPVCQRGRSDRIGSHLEALVVDSGLRQEVEEKEAQEQRSGDLRLVTQQLASALESFLDPQWSVGARAEAQLEDVRLVSVVVAGHESRDLHDHHQHLHHQNH